MRKILVVDDEPDILVLLRKRLERTGVEVFTTSDAEEALEALGRESWDLLITDVMMPGVNGFHLVQEAQRLCEGVSCIAVTGYGTNETMEQALETGCFGYIHKPFDWTYLLELVDKGIRSSALRRRGATLPGRLSQESKSAGGSV